jgi:hypothetical protein
MKRVLPSGCVGVVFVSVACATTVDGGAQRAHDDASTRTDAAPIDDHGITSGDAPATDAIVLDDVADATRSDASGDLARCVDTCTAPTCDGAQRVECVRGLDGCLHPQPGALCGAGEECAAGVCAPSCAHGCPAGFTCGEGGACRANDLSDFTIDYPLASVSGEVTFNGAPLVRTEVTTPCAPSDALDFRATVYFWDEHHGRRYAFTTTGCVGATRFRGAVIPGTYAVSVQPLSARGVPAAYATLYDSLVVGPSGLGAMHLDLRTFDVGGTLTVDGADPTRFATTRCDASSPSDGRAAIRFTDLTRGQIFVLPTTGCTGRASFRGALYPGTYRVTVERYRSPEGVERVGSVSANPQVVRDALVVPGSEVRDLHVNHVSALVSARVTINGADPRAIDTTRCNAVRGGRAAVRLVDVARGYDVSLLGSGCTDASVSWGIVYPGTYQVTVEPTAYAERFPYRVIHDPLVVTGGRVALALDVPRALVRGEVTVNGVQPVTTQPLDCPTTDGRDGRAWIRFTSRELGSDVVVTTTGCTGAALFEAALMPGTYDVDVYGLGSSNVPTNARRLIEGLRVPREGVVGLRLDHTATSSVRGYVTLNGASPQRTHTDVTPCDPAAERDGRVSIELRERSDRPGYFFSSRGCEGVARFAGAVAPGVYEVTVRGSNVSSVPRFAYPFDFPLVVGAEGRDDVSLDVRTVDVRGQVTFNGAVPEYTSPLACDASSAGDGRALVRFVNLRTQAAIEANTVGCEGSARFAVSVYPGTYRVDAYGLGRSRIPTERPVVIDRVDIR